MDRIALSKRLEGLSNVFADKSPYKRELKAMAFVLSNMAEDKFPAVLNPEYQADVEATEDKESATPFKGVAPMPEPKAGPGLMQKVRQRQHEISDGKPGRVRSEREFMKKMLEMLEPQTRTKVLKELRTKVG